MKTYSITAIKRKAESIKDGGLYLEDCRRLADEWEDDNNRAVISEDNVRWIKNKWNKKSAPEQTLRKPSVPAKSVAKSPKSDTWKKTVEEIRSSGNETWNEVLDLKLKVFSRLTPCQAKARKKKIIQDWTDYKSHRVSDMHVC